MVRCFLITLLCISVSGCVIAQVFDYSDPLKVPGAVNSEAEEIMPLLSPDGTTMYFGRTFWDGNKGGRYAGADVWLSNFFDGAWKKPDSKKFPYNTTSNDLVVGVSTNGLGLFMMRSSPNHKISGIYFSKRTKQGWDHPQLIPIPGIEGIGFTGFYVSPDFDVIFISMRGLDSRGEEDLYVSLKSSVGEWMSPKNMGPAINTTGFEITPFLSANKKRLYFSSNGYPGQGDADVFYTDRLYDSWETWTTPRNLGPQLNSAKFDAYFSTYGDTIAYFASNRTGGMTDLFQSKVTPGNESYAITQRYLTSREMAEALGGSISRKIVFDSNVSELSLVQKELLFFMANKIVRQPDINLHIVVQEEAQPELSENRQAAIYEELKRNGVEGYRMIVKTGRAGSVSTTGKTTIELMLFR